MGWRGHAPRGGTHARASRARARGGAPGGPCAKTVDRGGGAAQPAIAQQHHTHLLTMARERGEGLETPSSWARQWETGPACLGPPPSAPSKGILGQLRPASLLVRWCCCGRESTVVGISSLGVRGRWWEGLCGLPDRWRSITQGGSEIM